ncbi:MAG: phosphoribosyltransferase [Candidatus Binatia bacterium]
MSARGEFVFRNRADAGRRLAARLAHHARRDDVVVLGLPRGGVPVAFEVAQALDLPLDVFTVRKLGTPGHEELAMGAIASGGVRVLNDDVIELLRLPPEAIERAAEREKLELHRRDVEYRGTEEPIEVKGLTAIVVDDGLATGSTMRAAVAALRRRGAARVVVAVPTASPDVCEEIGKEVDEMICAETPEPFQAVGVWYEDFSQTSDREVKDLLARHRARLSPS